MELKIDSEVQKGSADRSWFAFFFFWGEKDFV